MANGDGAQPDGQGATPGDQAPYQEYLERLPEQVRPDVEPIFQEWDKNVTRRFQEASEYRKAWEPYEQLGVNQRSPEEIGWAMQFLEAMNDPPQIQAWYEQFAQETGLTPQEVADAAEGYGDPDVAALVAQQLEQHLGPLQNQLGQLTEWQQAQEQARAQQAATQMVDDQRKQLEAKHGDIPWDQVEKFIPQYIETDPENAVARAHADWQSFVSQIEKQTLAQKLGQPPAAESGGVADSAPENVSSLAQAGQLARQRLAQARLQ